MRSAVEASQQSRQTATHLPRNTLVVMPKTRPASHGGLWALGVLMGLFVREFVDGAGGAVGNARAAEEPLDAVQVAGGAPTMEPNVSPRRAGLPHGRQHRQPRPAEPADARQRHGE
jgi:hypothetical protein